jgi:flagellar biosynthesis/type III secretory pathway protein FliH
LSAETAVTRVRFPAFSSEAVPDDPPPSPVVDAIHAVREAARREGLARGRAEGRVAALAEWAPRLGALAAVLEETVSAVRADRERFAAEMATALPRAVVQLTQKIIEREVAGGEDGLRAAAAPVARRLAESGGTAIRVAPDVAEALTAWRHAGDAPAALLGVTIRTDETLARGDYIVETAGGLLDGRLATQLDEALRILTEPSA